MNNRKKYYTIARLQLYGIDTEPQEVFEDYLDSVNEEVGCPPEIKKLYNEGKLIMIPSYNSEWPEDEVTTIKAKFSEKEFLFWGLKNSHWFNEYTNEGIIDLSI